MAMIRWNPRALSSLFEDDFDMPTALSRFGLGQGLNLYETDDAVIAEAALPGVSEENIDVTIENGIVRITGAQTQKKEEPGKRRYFMTALASSYNYSFRLPEGIRQDEEPTAEYEGGILRLIFPKLEKTAPKRIKILTKNGKRAKEERPMVRELGKKGGKVQTIVPGVRKKGKRGRKKKTG